MQLKESTDRIAKSLTHMDGMEMWESFIARSIGNTDTTCRGIAMPKGLKESWTLPKAIAPTKAKTQP